MKKFRSGKPYCYLMTPQFITESSSFSSWIGIRYLDSLETDPVTISFFFMLYFEAKKQITRHSRPSQKRATECKISDFGDETWHSLVKDSTILERASVMSGFEGWWWTKRWTKTSWLKSREEEETKQNWFPFWFWEASVQRLYSNVATEQEEDDDEKKKKNYSFSLCFFSLFILISFSLLFVDRKMITFSSSSSLTLIAECLAIC